MPLPSNTSEITITETSLPTAGVLRRLAALVYDAFLLFGLLVAPLFIFTAIRSPKVDLQNGSVTHDLPSIAPQPVMLLYMILVSASFYCYFWRRNGQTLGMQAWRIRVDAEDEGCATLRQVWSDNQLIRADAEKGTRASWRQCLIRSAVGFVSLLCVGLGYWWIWIDKNRCSWHDRASNTRVVVLPKK